MNNKEADQFLEAMQWLDHDVVDLSEAIYNAMEIVPKINSNVWFGQIEDEEEVLLGTFYLNQSGSGNCRWFNEMDEKQAYPFVLIEVNESHEKSIQELERDLT